MLAAGAPPPLHPHFRQQLATHAAQYKKQFTAFFNQVCGPPLIRNVCLADLNIICKFERTQQCRLHDGIQAGKKAASILPPQVTRHPSLDLAFLSFRLDFNSYYESLSAEDAMRNNQMNRVPLTPDEDSESSVSSTPR